MADKLCNRTDGHTCPYGPADHPPFVKTKVVLKKTYHGFEDAADIERDVSECFHLSGLPGDFQGKLKVAITYEED